MLPEDNVIDNRNVILRNELLKILPETENASIAVGYFFISGLVSIIQPLKEVKKIRLLISNTTDKTTAEALIEGFHTINEMKTEVAKKNFVNEERLDKIKKDSRANTQRSLEHMSQTTDDKTIVKTLIDMMESKQLEVRVYPKEKLHAKAYIFQSKNPNFASGMGIVGSSNLSIAGISHNSELNLKTYNVPDVNQLLKWFDELWNEGLKFTDEFKLILGKSWAGRMYSPRDLFLRAAYLQYEDKLEGHHEIDPIWQSKFPNLFPFQRNAVDQCLTMFDQYGGMIIGDVVGLGKTYVGTALLKYLQLQEYRPLIICPPQLVPMWEKFCVDYEVDAKILSRGLLSRDNFELYQDYRYKDRDLILIDESHHFRNDNSRQYENVFQFTQARDAKAILLTATPYSNKPDDIKHQIMLFHSTEKTSIPPANETDLKKYFRQVNRGEANLIDLLKNIMVRRTRRYVLDQWGKNDENGRQYLQVGDQRKYFPTRKMVTQRYDINKVYQQQYETIVEHLTEERLTFARYSLGLYVKKEYKDIQLYSDLGSAGKKLVGLIRILLLKRMESSLEAFKQSIRHYIDSHNIFLTLLDEGIIPIGDVSYKAMYDIAKSDPDSINDPETIDEFKKKIKDAGETQYKFEAFDIDLLKKDIQNDVETFEAIDRIINRITWKTDDKLQQLQKLLDSEYSGKKVIIFTEFSTTAKYLNDYVMWKGKKEQADSSKGNSIQCARLFDPDNNPSNDPRPKKEDQISLLISTDVLSEGINLQTGEVIINYDFHWNPTRLIQRAGRVDRIGSKNECVIAHNFLLDLKMEKNFGLEAIVDNKIDEIQRIIGEDYKILKEEEQVNKEDIYAIYNGDESLWDRGEDDPLTPSKFETELRDIQLNNTKLWEDIRSMPGGIRGANGIKAGGKLLLACESGTARSGKVTKHYLVGNGGKINEITPYKVLQMLESIDESVYNAPTNYDELIAAGWKKFTEDTEQIRARADNVRLSTAQKWVREKLMKMARMEDLRDKRQEIDAMLKAYSIPILKGKLNRELLKIKKTDMDDEELLGSLSQLYLNYELQKQVKRSEEESDSPRILYSMYVGDKQHD